MKRRQLTLFLEATEAEPIENVRRSYNQAQFQLIKSHITLCREDEIEAFHTVEANLSKLSMGRFVLKTGPLRRFGEGKGVLLSVVDEEGRFQELRKQVLKIGDANPRQHDAHITLMHPRNSSCNDAIFAAIQQVSFPQQVTIAKISLIEQEIGQKWNVLQEYSLK